MYSIQNRECLENLNKVVSLESQVKAVQLQDKLGKQNFDEDMKKVFEPVTRTIKDVSEDVTKTMMITPKEKNLAPENLNNKLLEILNDRGIIECYFFSTLSKFTNPDNTTRFKLVEDSNLDRGNDLLMHNSVTVTLHDNLLTFCDIGKIFELKGDLLKMITLKNYNVYLASLSDKKFLYDLSKEMNFVNFDVKVPGNRNKRDRTLIKSLQSPSLMISASRVSKTKFLSSDPNELCDRVELLLQEKQAGNKTETFTDEIIALVDKLLEYKCISKNQPKQLLFNCNLLHEQV